METVKSAATSWVAWLNIAFAALALGVPGIKDLLTPELEAAIILMVNSVIGIVAKVKEGQSA